MAWGCKGCREPVCAEVSQPLWRGTTVSTFVRSAVRSRYRISSSLVPCSLGSARAPVSTLLSAPTLAQRWRTSPSQGSVAQPAMPNGRLSAATRSPSPIHSADDEDTVVLKAQFRIRGLRVWRRWRRYVRIRRYQLRRRWRDWHQRIFYDPDDDDEDGLVDRGDTGELAWHRQVFPRRAG